MATSTSSRNPHGLIDTHQPGDYPIYLGDSLKDGSQHDSQYVTMTYNWMPRDGFKTLPGTLSRQDDQVALVFDADGQKFRYAGWETAAKAMENQHHPSRLALVFDQAKSAFVLEKVSASLNLNLESATNQSDEKVARHRQIHRPNILKEDIGPAHDLNGSDNEDDTPDESNPFDYRHYLTEAREAADKASHIAGTRTPIPGSRTPLSGMASPIPSTGKFLSSTPQFRPTPVTGSKRTPETATRKKATIGGGRKASTSKAKDTTAKESQPLSKERISDSDEEMSDAPLATTAQQAPRSRGHTRNVSANIGRSPHIIVSDGGLEIDMGSPPPEIKRRNRIDPEAFRSQTGTPTFGRSSNRPKVTSKPMQDIEMKDSPSSDHLVEASSDDDVEELELGSPEQGNRRSKGKVEQSLTPPKYKPRSPSPPPARSELHRGDGEDDDDLAAALEAALEQEDDSGIGLGIKTGADEESEVSEEE